MNLNKLEYKILAAVQHGMPMSRTPYQDLADTIGIDPEQLLETIRQWQSEKKIRRGGAIVNHFQIGHGTGAMVVWQVPAERIDEVGECFASFDKVSHAYQRLAKVNWPYTIYTMVHAVDPVDLEQTTQNMTQKSGITEFRILKTVRELKKVPPTYIIEQ